MADLRLTFAIGDYLHMRELALGRVALPRQFERRYGFRVALVHYSRQAKGGCRLL